MYTGSDLRQLREAAKLNLTDILADCPIKGMDKPLLSKIERGIANPTEPLIKHYFSLCGKSINDRYKTPYKGVATGFKKLLQRITGGSL
jgi:transcriptional regulator with XRE-family HTH domain